MSGDTTEQNIFKFLTFGVAGLTAGVSLANIIYYNRIRNESCDAVTKGQARAMWVVNIIVFVLAMAVFIWSAVRIFFTREARDRASSFVSEKAMRARDKSKEYLRSTSSGVVGVTPEGRPRLSLLSRSSPNPTGNIRQ